MIGSVEITNFRGVREGKIEGLGPLSILVGPNNSGKSTCLEAMMCVAVSNNARNVWYYLSRRGGPAADALAHIAPDGEAATSVKVQMDVPEPKLWEMHL